MSDKDSIKKNKVNKKANESVCEEKENVKNKLQSNFLRLLINNIWLSVGAFALIAIPSSFYLFKNSEKNKKQKSITSIKDDVNPIKDTLLRLKVFSEPLINNLKIKEKIDTLSLDIKILKDNKLEYSEDSIVKIEDTAELLSSHLDELDTTLIEKNTAVIFEKDLDLNETRILKSKIAKSKEPIVLYKDRMVVQEKINHVSFYFVENLNDKLIFDRNGHRIFLTRKNETIQVATNSDKIKAELINLVILNKEMIYNYYSNLK